MPRMRTIKPDAATSETLAEVDRGARWTFGMFWTHCDDDGRAVWNLRLIKAAIYPLDDEMTPEAIAADFANLERVGAVCRYTVDGKEYVHVPSFADHQHPNRKAPSKLPECNRNHHCGTPHDTSSDDAVSEQEPLIPVGVSSCLVDVEAQSAGARTAPQPRTPDRFDEFYEAFPKHVAKLAAKRKWETIVKAGTDPQAIIDGAKRYAASVRGAEAQFIKQPDGWLNAGRWQDEPPSVNPREDDPLGWAR